MKLEPIFILGIVLLAGYLGGELARLLKLPKVSGYILAGVLLNPKLDILPFIPEDIVNHIDLITNLSLAFICFSVGGTLLYSMIKKLGKGILLITIFEGETAFLSVFIGFLIFGPMFLHIPNATMLAVFAPFALLIAAIASPTDPSAVLAVAHEYKAKGEVTDTMMGASAFDDVMGIMNYSFAVVFATVLVTHQKLDFSTAFLNPVMNILGSFLLGIVLGYIFNKITVIIKDEKPGMLIVLIFAVLASGYGVADLINVDQLLVMMVMGTVVVNYNPRGPEIFGLLEKYSEDMIFAIFFTLSGIELDFSTMPTTAGLILLFFIFRTIGKYVGTYLGATVAKSSENIKKYTIGGLIPSGGIVIGLALMIKHEPCFDSFSSILLNTTIGATIVHELLGPLTAKFALKKSGEI